MWIAVFAFASLAAMSMVLAALALERKEDGSGRLNGV